MGGRFYDWQWTDSFYTTLFLRNYNMLSSSLVRLAEMFAQWWMLMHSQSGAGAGAGAIAPMGYTQAIVATGMLVCLAPLVLLYLLAQKAFVESLSQTGIKM
jgi:multiple sugar transport system permease protein